MDTPGPHLEKIYSFGFNLVTARGPLEEDELINLANQHQGFDGVICGTDSFTAKALEVYSPRTKVISRYGVGLDRLDMEAAQKLGIEVLNTPRFNHATVAELTFGLMISISRKIPEHVELVKRGEWTRMTGYELRHKTISIFGFGMVGREVAKIALSFGMNVIINNSSWGDVHEEYLNALKKGFSDRLLWEEASVERCDNEEEALKRADYISLHFDLNRSTLHFLNQRRLELCKNGVFIINGSRGGLVEEQAIVDAINSGRVAGYGTDVVERQPIKSNNPLLNCKNVLITPHIGGRTFESVYKQGLSSVDNLLKVLKPLKT
jgi:D-3-phosphoglycerate dehydrogenase